ncbi:uncharacterized protein BJ212DRAFT_1479349 [Suillus subaureus]|uniref:Uncharacterized protein n=1 Tax=Suillus subaureus TaxID=48587 RepID=A0A9P7EEQ2_9AGAM|nr:uncharacterized protein BJ212DRAFT_1479349 [Suillus subaureus]KAG1819234.1 hypothetical protein BJ212DRAFT_1479349 [Suillus subaureus]
MADKPEAKEYRIALQNCPPAMNFTPPVSTTSGLSLTTDSSSWASYLTSTSGAFRLTLTRPSSFIELHYFSAPWSFSSCLFQYGAALSANGEKVPLLSIQRMLLSAKIAGFPKQQVCAKDDAPDSQIPPEPQIPQLPQQYINPSEADRAVRQAIDDQLENAPLRVIDTSTGRLCNREAQTNVFMRSIEYKELLPSMPREPLQMEPIREAESKEPLLRDIQYKDMCTLDPVGSVVKLQKLCKVARDAGHRRAWLQESVNSMFIWYHRSALTIVYLSDVLPSSQSIALARNAWNTRRWSFQELSASVVALRTQFVVAFVDRTLVSSFRAEFLVAPLQYGWMGETHGASKDEGYGNTAARHETNVRNDGLQAKSDTRDPVDTKIAETQEKQACLRKRRDAVAQREI